MKKIVSFVFVAALAAPVFANNVDATKNDNNSSNPAAHPVEAYRKHEVKKDIRESQINSQKAKEDDAAYKQAKSDYDKSLKDNGPNSPITQQAKRRMAASHQAMRKHVIQQSRANQELRKDQIDAKQQ